MNHITVRRARVRPEFAQLYPEITPEVWMSARKATRLVLKRGQREPCKREGCDRGRVLCEAHFEFRGGKRSRQHLTGIRMPRASALLGLDALA